MSCHHFKFAGGHGFVSIADVYRYKGFTFEFHEYCGPTKLKKGGEFDPRMGRRFYEVIGEWCKLTKKQKERTRV